MNRIFVRPGQPGLAVPRDYDVVPPYTDGQTIAADGEWVDHTHYIARRIRSGDLVEATPSPEPKPESAAPPAAAVPKAAKRIAPNPTATE